MIALDSTEDDVGSLNWMTGVLARLGCRFTVIEPTELRVTVRSLAERLVVSAGRGTPLAADR